MPKQLSVKDKKDGHVPIVNGTVYGITVDKIINTRFGKPLAGWITDNGSKNGFPNLPQLSHIVVGGLLRRKRKIIAHYVYLLGPVGRINQIIGNSGKIDDYFVYHRILGQMAIDYPDTLLAALISHVHNIGNNKGVVGEAERYLFSLPQNSLDLSSYILLDINGTLYPVIP
jgi:hypothetical protein